MLVPSHGGLAPPLMGNPGSAPAPAWEIKDLPLQTQQNPVAHYWRQSREIFLVFGQKILTEL